MGVPYAAGLEAKVVGLHSGGANRISLKALAEDLLITRWENPSAIDAAALVTAYPLRCMEGRRLIGAFCAWMDLTGADGVFVDGLHGHSDELPETATAVFADGASLTAVENEADPAAWSVLYPPPAPGGTKAQVDTGMATGVRADPGLLGAIRQSDLAQIARRSPGVCRISGVAGANIVMFDRLWLPISDRDGRIARFVTVCQPLAGQGSDPMV